ncbi:MAG: N-acetylmuramoyl-L-alanine amidase [Phycisphaerae bacterium]|nr:N-acetylmuramoyl-L-alanine amidase [Phycisphaerae bacterium]
MPRSRTIKTLAALVAAMTVGAFALTVMETAPIRPGIKDLAAVAASDQGPEGIVKQTDVEIQRVKWANIIVHSSASRRNIESQCHFVIAPRRPGSSQTESDDQTVTVATNLWKRQAEGYHIYVPGYDFTANSIGICLRGDFSHRRPAAATLDALVALVRVLQQECGISPDHVYLHSDLISGSNSPGRAFPARTFSASLLRPSR